MPLNVRKFGVSCFLVLAFIFGALAQSSPTSADVMRERITKVKALVAIKSYTAAIYELEGIRREVNDPAVNSVAQVMLMNCYLEQSDYKRAQALLTELFNAQKANKPNANYFAVAAQVVKGARSQLERYKSLGLMVSDRNLPVNAVDDINKMRETVENVITQSKTLGENKKESSDALALLEEAIHARSGLARDDYDAKRWKDEVADTRESLMNSRTIVNAVDDSAMPDVSTNSVAAKTSVKKTSETVASIIPVSNPATTGTATNETTKPAETVTQPTGAGQLKVPEKVDETPNGAAQNTNPEPQPPTRNRRAQNSNSQTAEVKNTGENKSETVAENTAKNDAPLAVGSLIDYATEKVNPTYPQAAKTMRTTGVVRVELIIGEDGQITEVQNASGPSMLQRAALDAVKKWKFKPFVRDGQPVKAAGFVNFNFAL
ncbi:MAG TPA: TonB family protein [Pyrinomonadaceae bacterium]